MEISKEKKCSEKEGPGHCSDFSGLQQDSLPATDYKIFQDREAFMYGSDAVLLSYFARDSIRNDNTVIDLGCGNGVIPLLLAAHSRAKKIIGIDIQENAVKLARKNVELNGLEEKIEIFQGNVADIASITGITGTASRLGIAGITGIAGVLEKTGRLKESEAGQGDSLREDFPGGIKKGSADIVISNPPYMKYQEGAWSDKNSREKVTAARHELFADLDDFVGAAAFFLKSNGKFLMIHRPNRLSDIFASLQKYKLEPKRLQFVHPMIDRPPTMLLIEARKNASSDLKILEPLIMYSSPGEKSEQIKKIYSFE